MRATDNAPGRRSPSLPRQGAEIAARFVFRRPPATNRKVILCYHSIHPTARYASATPSEFGDHLDWRGAYQCFGAVVLLLLLPLLLLPWRRFAAGSAPSERAFTFTHAIKKLAYAFTL